MARLRAAGALLALFAVALVVAWFFRRAEDQTLPTGSSRSYQDDGTQALFLWAQEHGLRTERLDRPALDRRAAPDVLLVVQPLTAVSRADRQQFEEVPRNGGTLVVAGDSLATRSYLGSLGVAHRATPIYSTATVRREAASLPVQTRNRVTAADATPLLLNPRGEPVALRKPYLNGWLVVMATPFPLTNAALQDQEIARFVLRQIIAPAPPGGTIAFDESHYALPLPEEAPPVSLRQVVLETAAGRAAVYAAALTFLYLLLAGQRLGPPLPPASAAETSRTMFEHVQALAGLYRRAGQFPLLREHFTHYYRRALARALGGAALPAGARAPLPPAPGADGVSRERAARLAGAVEQLAGARSETQLIEAVGRAEQAARDLARAGSGTLSRV